MEVVVPFGAGNKMRKAYVMEITDFVDFPEDKIKWVESINDKAIGMEQKVMSLAYWMKRQYGCTMIAAMQTVLPVKKKIKALYQEISKLENLNQALIKYSLNLINNIFEGIMKIASVKTTEYTKDGKSTKMDEMPLSSIVEEA